MSVLAGVTGVGAVGWYFANDALFGLALAVLALLVVYVIGSYRAWDKADRKGKRNLDLAVRTDRLQLLTPEPGKGATGAVLLFRAHITNRSRRDRVSLETILSVAVPAGHMVINEADHRHQKQLVSTEYTSILVTPLGIKRQKGAEGVLGFWVEPIFAETYATELEDLTRAGATGATLRVIDRVSGKDLEVAVPGEYSETGQ